MKNKLGHGLLKENVIRLKKNIHSRKWGGVVN